MTNLIEIRPTALAGPTPSPLERSGLERRARRLAWAANTWHVAEFGVALAAGIAANSVALIAFGVDSLIEVAAGTVVIWLFSASRGASASAERRAQRLIALTFFLLAGYVLIDTARDLLANHQPRVSWVGVGLAAVTAITMPPLASMKRRLARQLGSSAAVREAAQTSLCAYLSIALLIGLLLNAVAGLWWADPLAAAFIAVVAVKEGRDTWRGDECCHAC